MTDVVARLRDAGLIVSAFIDPDPKQVEACAKAGFDVCEVHTGPYAHAFAEAGGDFLFKPLATQLDAVRSTGKLIADAGMRFNAGHALNYANVKPIAGLQGIAELHIGHSIIARAVYTGIRDAVREMKRLMVEAAQG
jgi:pyridoxine 5-phosphate synthase